MTAGQLRFHYSSRLDTTLSTIYLEGSQEEHVVALDVTKPIMIASSRSHAAGVARICHMERRGFVEPVVETKGS
jgi:hypothetical protein